MHTVLSLVSQRWLAIYYSCGHGDESPQKVQKLANVMMTDVERLRQHYETILTSHGVVLDAEMSPKFPLLESLAGIGDHGAFSNNCNRDIMRLLQKTGLHKPSPTTLPIKDTSKPAGYTIDPLQFIMWPHELFSYIYHSYPDIWKTRICPGAEVLNNFWYQMIKVHNPLLPEVMALGRPDLRTKCIPITVHAPHRTLIVHSSYHCPR